MRPVVIIAAVCLLAASAPAQIDLKDTDARGEPLPAELEGVGVTERLDEQIPLAAECVDAAS